MWGVLDFTIYPKYKPSYRLLSFDIDLLFISQFLLYSSNIDVQDIIGKHPWLTFQWIFSFQNWISDEEVMSFFNIVIHDLCFFFIPECSTTLAYLQSFPCVERQAQPEPDRLNKPESVSRRIGRNGSVWRWATEPASSGGRVQSKTEEPVCWMQSVTGSLQPEA